MDETLLEELGLQVLATELGLTLFFDQENPEPVKLEPIELGTTTAPDKKP